MIDHSNLNKKTEMLPIYFRKNNHKLRILLFSFCKVFWYNSKNVYSIHLLMRFHLHVSFSYTLISSGAVFKLRPHSPSKLNLVPFRLSVIVNIWNKKENGFGLTLKFALFINCIPCRVAIEKKKILADFLEN